MAHIVAQRPELAFLPLEQAAVIHAEDAGHILKDKCLRLQNLQDTLILQKEIRPVIHPALTQRGIGLTGWAAYHNIHLLPTQGPGQPFFG